jgi:protein-S-isoprenylcysteine O-methyltransferase Ste14
MARTRQGFINKYRKPFFAVLMVVFAVLWLFTQSLWHIPYAEEFMEPAGTLLLFAGVIGRIFSTITIGGRKDQEVVKTEIYSTVRHPLYFFSFLLMVGIGLLTQRPELLLYMTTAYLAVFIPMIRNEEKFLTAKFGKRYTDYASSVPAFIPDFRLYKARERIVTSPKLIMRTIRDASLVLAIIPMVEIIEVTKKLMAAE